MSVNSVYIATDVDVGLQFDINYDYSENIITYCKTLEISK